VAPKLAGPSQAREFPRCPTSVRAVLHMSFTRRGIDHSFHMIHVSLENTRERIPTNYTILRIYFYCTIATHCMFDSKFQRTHVEILLKNSILKKGLTLWVAFGNTCRVRQIQGRSVTR
jgi:hypothetical protein